MPKAYLTIDDSPSPDTKKLVDFLTKRSVPALFFVRGDGLEQNPRAIEYAIQNGIMIGNHGFAHKPAGEMEPQQWADDLELCDHLIEAAYARCDIARPFKAYRFPYIDRGDGVKVEQCDSAAVVQNNKIGILQQYLHDQGFAQPFKNMPENYPVAAFDCLYTYTSRDWMLNNKHRGKHAIKTPEDLKARFDADEGLKNETARHILLFHDQTGIIDDVCAMIDHALDRGFEFLTF
ncbi:MAG: polysaccharide deacetylase family protein [Bdellovibrionales bacterium]